MEAGYQKPLICHGFVLYLSFSSLLFNVYIYLLTFESCKRGCSAYTGSRSAWEL